MFELFLQIPSNDVLSLQSIRRVLCDTCDDLLALWHITDINECLPNGGLGPCAQICTNTIGSFYCSCQPGYNLSGYACNGKHDKDLKCF